MNKYPWLDEYLLSLPAASSDFKQEWGWQRYLLDGKMFAATCQPGPEHKGYDCRELLLLKCNPALAVTLRAEHADIVPGFYSDKRHWNSVFLDGELPEKTLRMLCNHSYQLVLAKLSKKRQREIAETSAAFIDK